MKRSSRSWPRRSSGRSTSEGHVGGEPENPPRNRPLLRKVDCIRLAVDNLDAGIVFYARLGASLIWRRPTTAGLRLPEADAELVLQTEEPGLEVDLLVDDAEQAAARFAAGAVSAWIFRRTESGSTATACCCSKVRACHSDAFFCLPWG